LAHMMALNYFGLTHGGLQIFLAVLRLFSDNLNFGCPQMFRHVT
jgi:hypothetical protein